MCSYSALGEFMSIKSQLIRNPPTVTVLYFTAVREPRTNIHTPEEAIKLKANSLLANTKTTELPTGALQASCRD